MAEVWLANDISLSRKVAVKLMRAQHDGDPIVAERFRREAQASAALNHPNIVTVYDVVEDAGRQAVIMEYVDGKSLREVLDKHTRLSPALTVHIGMAVASALDAAHKNALVHRDIKPGNILITPTGRVLLTDFGIAKALTGNETDLTNDNIMMGTAKYLSPEQVRGKRLDGRADIYSLGLVLYECLAGRVPFIGGSDVETALARVQREPTDLLKLRPTLNINLARIIHQMLKRDPSHRPPTGEAVRAELYKVREEGLDGTPTGLTPPRGHTAQLEAPRDVANIDATPAGPTPFIPGDPVVSNPTNRPVSARTTGQHPKVASSPSTKPKPAAPRVAPSTMLAAAMLVGVLIVGVVLWRSISSSDPGVTTPAEATQMAPAPTEPVSILGVRSYDPRGDDGVENDDKLPFLLDGDPSTQWRTVCYGDKYFGAKEGVGFVAELSAPSTGTLTVNLAHSPWALEVYTALDVIPSELSAWGQEVDKGYGTEQGKATFNVKDQAKYVLVYLREIAESPQCSAKNPFQGVVAGVSFSNQAATP
jgi:serine/threonine-protein kinase